MLPRPRIHGFLTEAQETLHPYPHLDAKSFKICKALSP